MTYSLTKRAAWRAAALCLLGPAAAALAGDQIFTSSLKHDKLPRLDHGWVTWTLDESISDSRGTVSVRNLGTNQVWNLGPGFLPAISVAGTTARVAWLRWNLDDSYDIVSAFFGGTEWSTTTLATDVGFADSVRVQGLLTVWTQPDGDGRLAITVHDGQGITQLPGTGHCFRPELAPDGAGGALLVWDEYRDGSRSLDYEVWLAHWDGSAWSAPENISEAPDSADFAPAIALAPDGTHWIAWESNRGDYGDRAFVVRRLGDGSLVVPAAYPASTEAMKLGVVDLAPDGRSTYKPRLCVDEFGRPWLFMVSLPTVGYSVTPYDKQIWYTSYDGDVWAAPKLLSAGMLEERDPAVESSHGFIRVVYEIHSTLTNNSELAMAKLPVGRSQLEPQCQPPAGLPEPARPLDLPQLPVQRTAVVDGQPMRLLFADLHTHCGQSPDGRGERDHGIFFARDVAQLDAVSLTDHDMRGANPFLDWEYEQARRLTQRLQTPQFTIFPGFEWTNDEFLCQSEIIGHRAVVDSAHVYRYTDPSVNELPEFYGVMHGEDAFGTPHHLGVLGGASFLQYDGQAQPVTEVASLHGIFEGQLVSKLAEGARFGVTCAGDNHWAAPGANGLAGIWVPDDGSPTGPAIKAGLRARRCYGVVMNGMLANLSLNEAPLGSELVHAGDLLLRYTVEEAPGTTPLEVNITRNGDWNSPIYEQGFQPGDPVEDVVALPGSPDDAFYMLRVSRLGSTVPADTLLWSSPIWVDAEPADGYPTAALAPAACQLSSQTPFDLSLVATDPDGKSNVADISLDVRFDGHVLGTLPAWLLVQLFDVEPAPGGWQFVMPGLQLPPGAWDLVLQVRDKQGHLAVTDEHFDVTP